MQTIYFWLAYEFNPKRWSSLSIPLLTRKFLQDVLKFKEEFQIRPVVLLPVSHNNLKEVYFPEGLEFIECEARYIQGRVQFLQTKGFEEIEPSPVVLCFEPINSRTVKAALTKTFTFQSPRVLNYVLFSPLEAGIPEERKREVALNLVEFPTIYNGPASASQFREIQKGFLQPVLLKNQKAIEVPLGVDQEALEFHRRGRVQDSMVRFLYGGRLEGHKQVQQTIEVVKVLYEKGYPVRYTVQTTGKNSCKKLEEWAKEYPFLDAVYNAPRSVFYENCWTHDVFICASKIETFGLSFFEMMFGGMIGIFVKREWQRGLLRGVYLVDDLKGALEVAQRVVQDSEGARAQWNSQSSMMTGNSRILSSTDQNRKILKFLRSQSIP